MTVDDEKEASVEPAVDSDDLDYKPQGFLRRNAVLLFAVLAILVVGPTISRVIGSYRGIVLQVRDGEMLVVGANAPPRWLDDVGVAAGQVIEKTAGHWDPEPVEAVKEDKKLLALHARWVDTYEGEITEIIPPAAPGAASVAVINTDDGRQLDLQLWAEHLGASREGRRVAKNAGSWDPVLLPIAAEAETP